MSLGYAEKLSFREDLGGQLGAPELFDTAAEVEAKVERLAELVQQARRIIAFTGAGISTACGIPDFRGPNGIWTLQRAGQPLPRPKVSFTHAKPSLTHQVLVALMQAGKLDYLVSQNVDGLHLRSGIPRDRLAELHGNCFAERCHTCGTEYIRDFEVETVGFKRTGRRCSQPGCTASLRDHILDWEDALPEDELALSEDHAREADLAICLGTSLQITPACNLPLKATRTYKGGSKEAPGQLVIINLQRTQHDNKAVKSGGFACHARCDEVMRRLAQRLGLVVPRYVRRDAVVVGHQQHSSSSGDGGWAAGHAAGGRGTAAVAPTSNKEASEPAANKEGSRSAAAAAEAAPAAVKREESGRGDESGSTARGDSSTSSSSSSSSEEDEGRAVAIPFSVFVQSSHGPKCLMPMVQSVDFAFDDPHLKPASLAAPPFVVRRTAQHEGPLTVRITLHLHKAADPDKRTVALAYTAELEAGLAAKASLRQLRHEFVTQEQAYDVGDGAGAPAAAADAAAAAANGTAAPAAAAPDRAQAEEAAEQQLKKQRIS